MPRISPLTKQLLDDIEAKTVDLESLGNKAQLSADEIKRLGTLPQEIEELQKQAEASANATKTLDSAKGFLTGTGDRLQPIGAGDANFQVQHAEIKNLLDKITNSGFSITGKAGLEQVSRHPISGHMVSHESEGWNVPEAKWLKVQEPDYLRPFDKMMRHGIDSKKMTSDDLKSLSEGADPGGGYIVPPQYIARLIARKPYPTRILEFVDTIPCSSDQVIIPRINFDTDTADIYAATAPRIQWIGEKGPTPSQTDILFGNVQIQVNTGQFYVEVTRNLMEDAVIPVDQIVQKYASQAYELGFDNMIVSGTGTNQPTGFLTNAGGAGVYLPIQNIGNPVSANGLTSLVYGLPPQYSDTAGVVAVMNRTSAFANFAQIQDQSGQYIFGLARSGGPEGMTVARKPELFGYPVVFSAFMPNIGAGNNVVAFGDMKEAYTLCQRVGLTVEAYGSQDRSMLLSNKVGWLFRFRAGGQVTQNRAAHVGAQQ